MRKKLILAVICGGMLSLLTVSSYAGCQITAGYNSKGDPITYKFKNSDEYHGDDHKIRNTVEYPKILGDEIYYAVRNEDNNYECINLLREGRLKRLNWGVKESTGLNSENQKIIACLYNKNTFSGNEGNFADTHCSIKADYKGGYKTARVE